MSQFGNNRTVCMLYIGVLYIIFSLGKMVPNMPGATWARRGLQNDLHKIFRVV